MGSFGAGGPGRLRLGKFGFGGTVLASVSFLAAVTGANAAPGPVAATLPGNLPLGALCVVFWGSQGGAGAPVPSTTGKTIPVQLDYRAGVADATANIGLYVFKATRGDAGAVITLTPPGGVTASVLNILIYTGAAGVLALGGVKFNSTPDALSFSPPAFAVPSGAWAVTAALSSNTPPVFVPGTSRGADPFGVIPAWDSNGAVKTAGGGTWSSGLAVSFAGYSLGVIPG